MSTSRWLNWTPPDGQIIEKSPDPEPSKPSKGGLEGFAGSTSGLFQNFEAVPGATDQISPKTSIIGKGPTTEHPPPPKRTSEGFEGATTGIFQNSECASELPRDPANSLSPAYRFPSCPRCSSFSLYRKNNVADYQCMSCELIGISEIQARRIRVNGTTQHESETIQPGPTRGLVVSLDSGKV
jgi:hypothetical protein